eukprot:11416580-Alexandrium_andersonii.AAC.1
MSCQMRLWYEETRQDATPTTDETTVVSSSSTAVTLISDRVSSKSPSWRSLTTSCSAFSATPARAR